MDDATIAQRVIEDQQFAQAVLDGTEGSQAVRNALVADLAENSEVTGFLNPQPLPPGRSQDILSFSWGSMSFPNLGSMCASGQHMPQVTVEPPDGLDF